MPTFKFTDRGLKALKSGPTRTDFWDDGTPGPGLLGMRVSPAGLKTWNVAYRISGLGPWQRLKLGEFPLMGYAEARKIGKSKLAEAQAGIDPAAEKQVKREQSRETIAALFEKYAEHAAVRCRADDFRSWDDVQRSLVRDVLPAWGARPVTEIRRKDIKELVAHKALSGVVAANRLLAHVSMLLSYAVDLEWLDANPAIGIKKNAETPRNRHLSPADIVTLWSFLDGEVPLTLTRGKTKPITMMDATAATLRDVFKTLLLLGQRLTETSNMKWADVDLDARVWTISATDAKNGTAHPVWLSRQAYTLLKARYDARAPDARFVFPCGGPRESSVKVWSQRAAAAIGRAIGVPFRSHDLRRTAATGMGELGIDESVISLTLNHKKQGVTGRHYNLSVLETAQRDAWQRWADRVDAIVTGQRAKVIDISAARSA